MRVETTALRDRGIFMAYILDTRYHHLTFPGLGGLSFSHELTHYTRSVEHAGVNSVGKIAGCT